jgi:hypothetical protein
MRIGAVVVSLLALSVLVPSPTAGAAPERRPVAPAQGRRVNPHEVPTQPPTGDTPEQIKEVPRHLPVDQATYARLKAQADAAAAARDKSNAPGSLETGPAAQFATLTSTQTGGWNPPDGGLAVGPTSVLSMANEAVAIYDRSGALKVGPTALPTFFKDSAGSVYDPRALYDAGNAAANGYNGGHGRFVLLATDGTNFTLAVSKNETPESPATTWCSYLINGVTGNDWVDYPSLGMDGDNLYLTSNQFLNGSNAFEFARLMVVPKASVYPDATTGACATASGTDFTNLQNPGASGPSFTVQPATQPDALPGTGGSMYLVNAIWSSGSNIVVRSVTMTSQGLAVSDPNWVSSGFIAPYNLPASVPQPNSSARIDSGDSRLLGAVYRYGSIYTANATATTSLSSTANPYANVQWYQITPTGPTTSFGSSNVIASSSIAYFFPGVIPVCASGPNCTTPKVVVEASVSGRNQPASAAVVANGTSSVFQRGVGGYRLNSRWGDYPAVAADPTSPGRAWFLGEYARTTTAWGTATSSLTP